MRRAEVEVVLVSLRSKVPSCASPCLLKATRDPKMICIAGLLPICCRSLVEFLVSHCRAYSVIVHVVAALSVLRA